MLVSCQIFVMQMLYICVYVHPVAVLNAAFCMTCNLLMVVEDARGDHVKRNTPEPVSCLPYR